MKNALLGFLCLLGLALVYITYGAAQNGRYQMQMGPGAVFLVDSRTGAVYAPSLNELPAKLLSTPPQK
jgi:hypothetical protein